MDVDLPTKTDDTKSLEEIQPEVKIIKRSSPEPERKSPENNEKVVENRVKFDPDLGRTNDGETVQEWKETPQKRTSSIMSKIRENIAKKSQSVKVCLQVFYKI